MQNNIQKPPVDFRKLNLKETIWLSGKISDNDLVEVLLEWVKAHKEKLKEWWKITVSGIVSSNSKQILKTLQKVQPQLKQELCNKLVMDFSPVSVSNFHWTYVDIGIALGIRKKINERYFNLSNDILKKLRINSKRRVNKIKNQVSPTFLGEEKLKNLIEKEENRGYEFYSTNEILKLPKELSEKILKLWTTYFGTPEELVRFDMVDLTENKIPVYYVKKQNEIIAALVMYPFGKGLPDNVYHSVRWTKKKNDNFNFSSLLAYSLLEHSKQLSNKKLIVVANVNIFTALKSASKIFKINNPLFYTELNNRIIPIKRFDGVSPFDWIYHFVTLQVEI